MLCVGRGEGLIKFALLEDCSRLDSLTSAWALGTLQRQAAHEQGKAVMSQIEHVMMQIVILAIASGKRCCKVG